MNAGPMMVGRTLTDAELGRLTVDALNAGLRSYRPDLRHSREDAQRFAELWNQCKVSTLATVVSVDGLAVVIVTDAAP